MIFKKKLLYSCAPVLLMILLLVSCVSQNVVDSSAETQNLASVRIGDVVVEVEMVENLEDQIRGLSGRESLGINNGMLFVYGDSAIRSFWMKDMKFAIDIIFIKDECHTNDANEDANYANMRICEYMVVDLVENLLPPELGKEPMSYTSKEATSYVLELNAGFIDRYGIKVGDRVLAIFRNRTITN
ncbi:MAG: DUF192 domain-containing protein [Proteobacteria bacterium]|nr:DUF192 domain-containing protein [Pseudomonadota bacterium]